MKQEKKNIIKSSLFVALFFVLIALSISFLTSGRNNGQSVKSIDVSDDKINKNCEYNGMKMYGKVQFVNSFPDIKVQVVESFPDLKVKLVDAFPNDCGKWQIVTSFPDLKVQIVESFPDLKIKFVDSFPGKP